MIRNPRSMLALSAVGLCMAQSVPLARTRFRFEECRRPSTTLRAAPEAWIGRACCSHVATAGGEALASHVGLRPLWPGHQGVSCEFTG